MTSPVAATVGPTGISAPNYAAIFAYLVSQFEAIYGADSYLGNDSADGQWIGTIAQAISDCNSAAIAVYNSFSPTTGQGAGLSSNVKLNGLSRLAGSFSTQPVALVGQAQTVITNGQVQDNNGISWALPASVTIPNSGTITVTSTCTTIGAIVPGTQFSIATPVLGWQSVSATGVAVIGNPVENDAQLRVRQSNSVALPSNTVFVGIAAAISQVTGVTRMTPYENNTNTTNSNGIPANTLCFVVEGGTQAAIANAIASKAPPGTATYGNVSTSITDSFGAVRTLNYQTATESTVTATVGVHPLNGWATSTIALISAAINAFIATIPIGSVVNVSQINAAALLLGTSYASTFLVKSVTININGGAYQGTDIALTFAQAAAPGNNVINTV